jgi:tripartite ATP-independent transporter DctP family solute receptor
MKMRLFSILIVCMAVVLIVAGCGNSNNNTSSSDNTKSNDKAANEPAQKDKKETKVIKAGIGLNDQHPQYLGLLKFKEIVEEKTDGEITVQTFHSGQLGDDRTMTEALQLGSQEVTIPSTAPLANFVPEFSVFDFPFIFPNEQVADIVLDGPVGQKFLDKLESQELVGLAFWENGFRNVTNSKRAIKTVEDFKGLKLRTMENEVHLEAFRALGANPAPMAFTELFTAMQQGTVDGQENPFATIYLSKFYEAQSFFSNTNHVYSPFVFLMSKSFYDELTPDQQQIVRDAAIEAGALERQLNREANEKYVAELVAEGMEYSEITPEENQKMKELVQPVIDKFSEKIGQETVKEVYDAVEAASNQ